MLRTLIQKVLLILREFSRFTWIVCFYLESVWDTYVTVLQTNELCDES
jgi:hypothetical protein